ncbi:hypothetical protein Mycch_1263 [Mycolicibacterium chubuense NBB4]|uniref:Uncharacterized protein n=1 Tax=Mycolicibacterium chubuense (strain NBB4) TaxID=710421 RepID=I4BFL4_MYCCN|nr:Ig-like domain-containing protein [Mycolicibacterium chubuense]AFM16071.1 hypothetical protein Mycch_1263 [Mycolicibacterium chubuense NBB4]
MAVRSHRRAQQFGVRQWLALGAASAGVSAALLGFALTGPQVGVAAADSSSAASSASSHASTDRSARADARKAARAERHRSTGDSAGRTPKAQEAPKDDTPKAGAKADTSKDDEDQPSARRRSAATPVEAAVPVKTVSTLAAPDSPAPADASPPKPSHEERVAQVIAAMSASAQAWIDGRPVSDARKQHLEKVWNEVRRTLLNQAPTVTPVQVGGVIDGPVTGTLNGQDPDGDRIVYRVAKRPENGTVHLNKDGTYTYTPGAGFNGVDTFTVKAADPGLHVNVIDWFQPAATRAVALVNHDAIKFDFQYTTGAEYWTPDRRAALQDAANALAAYFRVTAPVVLSYDIEGVDNSSVTWLAGASSDLISEDPGYWATVIQNKMQGGGDSNGTKADGSIEWNFSYAWALGDTVDTGQYDFKSTAMHELMHSFGFSSETVAPGKNTQQVWSTFDSFLRAADGSTVIGDDLRWPTSANPYLVGGDGGLFFGGANAVAAYGGKLVPLFTPNPWKDGSSGSHLDENTFTGDDYQMMNPNSRGIGLVDPRTLGPIELGILMDIGYTVVPVPSNQPSFALVGGVV